MKTAGVVIDNWLPIETAPVETPILVSDGKEIFLCVLEHLHCGCLILPYGFSGHDCEADFLFGELKYWCPLPELPT